MLLRRALFLCCWIGLAGCGKSGDNSGDGVQIVGNERIGWDQQAADTSELSTFHYRLWVDGVSHEMTDALCGTDSGSAGFPCTGGLPQMPVGSHTLELSAYVDGSPPLESARSSALRVRVTGQLTVTTQRPRSFAPMLPTADGIQLQPDLVADGLNDVTDLAFTSDGRIFVSERAGRVRTIANGQLQPEPAVTLDDVVTGSGRGLLAVAVDPRFKETSFVYGVYTATTGMQLVRFVESHGRFVNRAVLLSDLPYRPDGPGASLRFGPDNKLYLGLDDGGDAARAGDLGSYSGKVLRLNPDATTPADQAGGTPVYVLNVNVPRGLAWAADGETLWVAQTNDGGTGLLQATLSAGRDRRAQVVARYGLPTGTTPVSAAMYRGDQIEAFRNNLLVAIGEPRELLRLRLNASNPTNIVETERLPADMIEAVRAIGVSPAGSIYLCSAQTVVVLRLAPSSVGGAQSLRFPG